MSKSEKSKSEKAANPKKTAAKKMAAISTPSKGLTASKPAPPQIRKPGASGAKASLAAEEIALRAYFIAERRAAMGWPGDSTGDWLQAEQQLHAEATRNR